MSTFLDTNILIRHLTGDPPDQAARATAFLADAYELLLVDLVVTETIDVLESFYEQPRARVAELLRAILGFPAIRVIDDALVHRALEIYEYDRLDFADAYLVASAEGSGIATIASFDRSIDRRSKRPARRTLATKGLHTAYHAPVRGRRAGAWNLPYEGVAPPRPM